MKNIVISNSTGSVTVSTSDEDEEGVQVTTSRSPSSQEDYNTESDEWSELGAPEPYSDDDVHPSDSASRPRASGKHRALPAQPRPAAPPRRKSSNRVPVRDPPRPREVHRDSYYREYREPREYSRRVPSDSSGSVEHDDYPYGPGRPPRGPPPGTAEWGPVPPNGYAPSMMSGVGSPYAAPNPFTGAPLDSLVPYSRPDQFGYPQNPFAVPGYPFSPGHTTPGTPGYPFPETGRPARGPRNPMGRAGPPEQLEAAYAMMPFGYPQYPPRPYGQPYPPYPYPGYPGYAPPQHPHSHTASPAPPAAHTPHPHDATPAAATPAAATAPAAAAPAAAAPAPPTGPSPEESRIAALEKLIQDRARADKEAAEQAAKEAAEKARKEESERIAKLEALLLKQQEMKQEKLAAKKAAELEAKQVAADKKREAEMINLEKLEKLFIAQKEEQLKREEAAEAARKAEREEADARAKKEAEEKKAAAEEAAKLVAAAKKAREEAEAKAKKEAEEAKEAHEKALAEAKKAQEEAEKAKKAAEEEAEKARKAAEEEKAKLEAEKKKAEEEAKAAADAAAAAAAPKPEEKKKPIRFKDAVGRKFSFPWHLCKTWRGMEELIKQAFLNVDKLGPRVQEGQYDLVGPDGEIILPQVWETVVQPDWAISMMMWPMAEPEPKPAKAAAAAADDAIVTVTDGFTMIDVGANPVIDVGPKKPAKHGKDKGKAKAHAAHAHPAVGVAGPSAIPVPPTHHGLAGGGAGAGGIPIPPMHHGSGLGGGAAAAVGGVPMVEVIGGGGSGKPKKAARPPSTMLGWFAGGGVRPNQSLKGPKNEAGSHHARTIPSAVNGGNAHARAPSVRSVRTAGGGDGGCVVM